MAQQLFDDGSSLSIYTDESGGDVVSSTYATDTTNTTSSSTSGSGLFSGISKLFGTGSASADRLLNAGLISGGLNTNQASGAFNAIVNTSATTARAKDWRVSITLADPSLFGITRGTESAIQSILAANGGVIFPYVPSITVQNNARYTEQSLTHSNYKNYFYDGSDVAPITITGDFTVQNIAEGQYLLAAIYFFRSATKMFFGGQTNAGNPPPLVKLNGYGRYYFPDISCVVTQFSHTMVSEVDYLEVPVLGSGSRVNTNTTTSIQQETVRMPTTSQISVTVQPVYSRKIMHENFDLAKFSRGQLITNGGFI
jgi:hypothetical protein